MKRVLLTGGSGFIGRQAVPLLLERGYDVHAVSLQTPPDAKKVHWHQADLLDAEQRRALMEAVKPTHVLHFAWIATPGVYWTSPLNEDWRSATEDLLTLARAHGAKRFVGAGTCAEYDWSEGHCEENGTPLLPTTPYGQAKADAGQAVMDGSDAVSTAWGRVFFLYGPYENPRRLVASVIQSLLRAERAQCTHGRQVRDFLHVRDAASAFVSLLESGVMGPVNVASGNPSTIREVIETLADHLGRSHLVDFDVLPVPASDPPRLTAAVQRLRDEVRWQPSFSLQAGIADTVNWWRAKEAAGK